MHARWPSLLAVLIGLMGPVGAIAQKGTPRMTFKLTSPAFVHQAGMPARHTCQGEDLSPALQWENLPDGTKSLALIVDDPDAPDPAAPKMT